VTAPLPITAFVGNFRYGSKADIQRHAHLRPLSGVKRTSERAIIDLGFIHPWLNEQGLTAR